MSKKEYKVFKTIDECVAGMTEVRTKLSEAVDKYNSTESKEEADKLSATITELRDEYNEYSSRKALMTCLEADKPIMAAIRMSAYPVIKTSKKENESGGKTIKVTDDAALIDFTKFNSKIIPWFYEVESLEFVLVSQICKELGIALPSEVKVKDADDLVRVFRISKEAAEAAVKESASKTTIKKIISSIVTNMVGEEYAGKVESKDTTYLVYNMTRGDKKKRGSVKVEGVKWLMKLVADVATRTVIDGEYSADFSKIVRKQK